MTAESNVAGPSSASSRASVVAVGLLASAFVLAVGCLVLAILAIREDLAAGVGPVVVNGFLAVGFGAREWQRERHGFGALFVGLAVLMPACIVFEVLFGGDLGFFVYLSLLVVLAIYAARAAHRVCHRPISRVPAPGLLAASLLAQGFASFSAAIGASGWQITLAWVAALGLGLSLILADSSIDFAGSQGKSGGAPGLG